MIQYKTYFQIISYIKKYSHGRIKKGNMKIAIINSVYKYGSTGRICSDLATYFNENGETAKVFYGRKRQRKDKQSIKFCSSFETLLNIFISRIFDCDGRLSFFATLILINKLKHFNPDVLLINNMHGYYLNMNLLFNYIRKSGCKSYFTLHDCWTFTGHCAHFESIGCAKWITNCSNCPRKKEYPSSWVLDRSKMNHINKINLFDKLNNSVLICPSNWLASMVTKSRLSNKNIVVIKNGVDINTFKKVNTTFKEKNNLIDYKLILCVASIWNKAKGIEDIVKLSEILPNNFKIVLVGNTRKLKIPKTIISIPKTRTATELREIYSACDVFFNPTYEDTFPTVNIEALCCKLPVVSYITGGSVEMIDKSFAVKKGDILDALIKIKKIVIDGSTYSFLDPREMCKENTLSNYYNLIVAQGDPK